jgi:predicted nucleic acid-binding protein
MKLYLDICVYNRPFDYQGQERVALETSAFIYIIEKVEKSIYSISCSEALVYENDKSLDEERKDRISSYFNLAEDFVKIENADILRAHFLNNLGFSDMDALHIALAEKGNSDYFVTCDDDIIKLYKRNVDQVKVKIVSIIELVGMEG